MAPHARCSHLLRELGSSTCTPRTCPRSSQLTRQCSDGAQECQSESREGDREARLFAQSQIQQLLRNTNLGGKKKITVFKTAEIAGCCRGCLPLKLFQFYIQFWVWDFLLLCFLNLSRLPKGVPGTIYQTSFYPGYFSKLYICFSELDKLKKYLQPF